MTTLHLCPVCLALMGEAYDLTITGASKKRLKCDNCAKQCYGCHVQIGKPERRIKHNGL